MDTKPPLNAITTPLHPLSSSTPTPPPSKRGKRKRIASDSDNDTDVIVKREKPNDNPDEMVLVTPTPKSKSKKVFNSDSNNSDNSNTNPDSNTNPSHTKKKKKDKPKKASTSSKPSMKLQYINGKREHIENLLKLENRKTILKHIWKMIHEVWHCTSNRTLEETIDLWDKPLLPFPFLGEPDPGVQSSSDIRGQLDWKVTDVDGQTIDIYFIHSLGTPILKRIQKAQETKVKLCVIVIDNCPSSEKEVPKDAPKGTLIFSSKRFMFDYMAHHYTIMTTPVALSDYEIGCVLKKYDKDVTRYPMIPRRDPMILFIFGFHPPKMINTPRVSITAGISPYYRVVSE